MNFEQKVFMTFMATILIGFIAFTLTGCKTAQKTESPEWHYNSGRQDMQNEISGAVDQMNEHTRKIELERDAAREGWNQCQTRLTECLEAGIDK